MDPRVADWADLLVTYSMDVQEGDVVQIVYDPPAEELALETYRAVLQAGGHHPGYPRTEPTAFQRVFYEEADEEQLTDLRHWELDRAADIDARVKISAPENESELADVPAENRQTAQQARMDLREEMLDSKWVGTKYPTRSLAQKAGMSYEDYYEFVVDACVKDWEQEAETYLPLKDVVDAGSEVRLVGEGTDLTFSIGVTNGVNRVGLLSDGTHNVPGGEVFTAPIKETVNGTVYFDLPSMVQGKEVSGIQLTFEDGKITEYSAEKGESLLDEQLNVDEGARYLGEFGIGTNFAITQPTKDILFDEKIGGTIHLAVGRAYKANLAVDPDSLPQTVSEERLPALLDETRAAVADDAYSEWVNTLPNTERSVAAAYREAQQEMERQHNQSATHWDMIKDLRDTGRLEIDGEVILENGSFVGVDTLP